MKSMDLLETVGSIRDQYILEAHSNQSGRKKPLPFRKTFLIAAVIAMLLLLAGCVAVIMGLNELKIGHFTFQNLAGETKSGDFISLQGYIDSDSYKASQEWNQFLAQYDPEGELLKQAEAVEFKPPMDYMSYTCYTPDMVKKIDDICSKYSLDLLGPTYLADTDRELLAVLGIDSLTAPDAAVDVRLGSGYYYRDGSFALEGDLEPAGDNHSLPGGIFEYRCIMKTTFDGVALNIGDSEVYDQWNYTVSDGTEVLLALSEEKALIIADKDRFFVTVHIPAKHMSETGLEAAADAFVFAYTPQKPNPDVLTAPEWYPDTAETADTYADYFASWLPGSVGSEAYSPDYQQKFVDLDTDGSDEMLIWNARTGVIYEVVTQVNGEPVCVYGGGTYAEDDHTVALYLCEGNILEKDCANLQGKQLNEYYRLQDRQLVMVECLMESTDGTFYWSESGGASSLMWKEISAAEYDAARNKYIRFGVAVPQSADAVEDMQETEENVLLQVLKNQALFYSVSYDESCTLEEYCASESDVMGFAVGITRYAFVDLDHDGIREAVADFRFGENSQVMCMVLRWDSSNETVSGTEFYHRQMSQIKEDGTFAYSGGGDSDGWAGLRWENGAWVTEPAGDSSGKADIQWYSYPVTDDGSV